MRCPSTIEDEQGRLIALDEHGLRPGVAVPSLTPIVEIAVRLFDVPAAAVNMIGSNEVFFAASAGVGECDMRRDVSFCAHAITQGEVMVVLDALVDPRFHDNPLVTGGMIRFYAGVPLRAPSGHALGALCIVDSEPRPRFDEQDRMRLKELAGMASEKLELRRLELAREASSSGFAAIAANSPNAVVCFDQRGAITAWNMAATAMFGYTTREALGRNVATLLAEQEQARVLQSRTRAPGDPAQAGQESDRFVGLRKGGAEFPAELSWSHWAEGGEPRFGIVLRDVTQRMPDQDALYQLANYDPLTGLPNRNLLQADGAAAFETQGAAGVVLIGLDGFKDVNTTLGHSAGDRILCEVAERLSQVSPPGSQLARTGGDEFVILLPGGADPVQLSQLAAEAISAIGRPAMIDGQEVRLAASCGLAIGPQHGATIDELLDSADLALSQAKIEARGGLFLYLPNLRAESVARRLYEAELHRAVERDELRLHYQPIVRLSDGTLTGAEALLRWQHPKRQLLQPAAFIPAIEAGPLAAPVGTWILDVACAQAAEWRRANPAFRVTVNLFAAQFRAGDLPDVVAAALARHGLPPEALELEITENIALDQAKLVLPQLRAVRDMGVALAFDDFGTGYASLNVLKDYPVSHIKIDKSFVQGMLDSPHDRAIVTSLIGLSRQLNLNVIAEGVETGEQCITLRAHACQEGQGYLFGRPMAPELFAEKFGFGDGGSLAVA